MIGESFLVEVQQIRDMQTLLSIIQQYVRPGSVVYSDEKQAYSQLQSHNYSHLTVNHHSLNFVDPVTGAPTQCVGRMLGACKQMLREKKTMHSTLFETYLPEFIWRRKVDNFRDNSFN